jgi:ADP-ribosylglycohydrolase
VVLDEIVAAWIEWSRTAADVGVQTRQVLAEAARNGGTAAAARVASRTLHERTGRSAGNGSLMRTAPVALAHLHDADALAEAARALSSLTHWDDDAGDACVLWSLAIRHAVLTGDLDARIGLAALPAERRDRWAALLDDAERRQPRNFVHNGWVVEAVQGAWSSIHHARAANAGQPAASATTGAAPTVALPGAALIPAAVLRNGLERAVRGGRDTDTVAAIAGGLLGGALGASAVPSAWRLLVHGWPGLRTPDLVELAVLAANGGEPDSSGWPTGERMDYAGFPHRSALVTHPHDDGVVLGAIDDLEGADVEAVVSLCRIGTAQRRLGDHVEVWLIDDPDPAKNPNLDAVLRDAAGAVATFRSQGKRVLLHCVQAQSRTPSVAALYAALYRGIPIEQALTEVVAALPAAEPQAFLTDAVRRIARP